MGYIFCGKDLLALIEKIEEKLKSPEREPWREGETFRCQLFQQFLNGRGFSIDTEYHSSASVANFTGTQENRLVLIRLALTVSSFPSTIRIHFHKLSN
jgi:hypothetical protein